MIAIKGIGTKILRSISHILTPDKRFVIDKRNCTDKKKGSEYLTPNSHEVG